MTDAQMHETIVLIDRLAGQVSADDVVKLHQLIDYVIRLRGYAGESGPEAGTWEARANGDWLAVMGKLVNLPLPAAAYRNLSHLDAMWWSRDQRARGFYTGVRRLKRKVAQMASGMSADVERAAILSWIRTTLQSGKFDRYSASEAVETVCDGILYGLHRKEIKND